MTNDLELSEDPPVAAVQLVEQLGSAEAARRWIEAVLLAGLRREKNS